MYIYIYIQETWNFKLLFKLIFNMQIKEIPILSDSIFISISDYINKYNFEEKEALMLIRTYEKIYELNNRLINFNNTNKNFINKTHEMKNLLRKIKKINEEITTLIKLLSGLEEKTNVNAIHFKSIINKHAILFSLDIIILLAIIISSLMNFSYILWGMYILMLLIIIAYLFLIGYITRTFVIFITNTKRYI